MIDVASGFTAGAGMITGLGEGDRTEPDAASSAAGRLARLARQAGPDAEATAAVEHAFEEMLT